MQDDLSLQESLINSPNTINNNKSSNNDNSDRSIDDEIINSTRSYSFRECQSEKIGDEIKNSFTQIYENPLEIIPDKPIEDSIKCLIKEILTNVISNSVSFEKDKYISEIKHYIEISPQIIHLLPQIINNQLRFIIEELSKITKDNYGNIIIKISEEINSCYEAISGNKIPNLETILSSLLIKKIEKQKQIDEEVIKSEFHESTLIDLDKLEIHSEFNAMNLPLDRQTSFFAGQVFYEKEYHKINQQQLQHKAIKKRTKCSELHSIASKTNNRICPIQSKGIKICNEPLLHKKNEVLKAQQKRKVNNKRVASNDNVTQIENRHSVKNINDIDLLVEFINDTKEQGGKRKKKKKNKKNKSGSNDACSGNTNINGTDISDDVVNNFKNILGNSSIVSLSIKKIAPKLSEEWLTNLENLKQNYSSS